MRVNRAAMARDLGIDVAAAKRAGVGLGMLDPTPALSIKERARAMGRPERRNPANEEYINLLVGRWADQNLAVNGRYPDRGEP